HAAAAGRLGIRARHAPARRGARVNDDTPKSSRGVRSFYGMVRIKQSVDPTHRQGLRASFGYGVTRLSVVPSSSRTYSTPNAIDGVYAPGARRPSSVFRIAVTPDSAVSV